MMIQTGTATITVDGRPIAQVTDVTLEERTNRPLQAFQETQGRIMGRARQFVATFTTALTDFETKALRRFVASLRAGPSVRRAQRHWERPPTRGYWMKRCRCVACGSRRN